MDLNYLFHRQQVEHSRAAAADSPAAGRAHAELARGYEAQIERLSAGNITFPADRAAYRRAALQAWLGMAAAAGAAVLLLAYFQSR